MLICWKLWLTQTLCALGCCGCFSGETKVVIEKLQQKIADLDAKLTNLVQKRSCDLQNAAANNHNTLNHVQRLLLVPQGARPGELPVATCTVTHAPVPAVVPAMLLDSCCQLRHNTVIGVCCRS